MTKRRNPFPEKILLAVAILMLLAADDSLAQPGRPPRRAPGVIPVGQPLISVRPQAGEIVLPDEIVQPGAAYFIKSKQTQTVLDAGRSQPGTEVRHSRLSGWQYQKFIFTDAGGGYFHIRTAIGGNYITLKQRRGSIPGRGGTGTSEMVLGHYLSQELLSTNPVLADAQKWKVVSSDEPTCFRILNKAVETQALQPSTGIGISAAQIDGSDLQKWVLKWTTAETNPQSATAENGLVADCFATVEAFKIMRYKHNISQAFPEWRSVGETYVPDGVTRPPLRSYKILEGVVSRGDIRVATQDLPSAHFTHDFNFSVTPDPAFKYLTAAFGNVVLSEIEVEWESGLAQGDDKRVNPAAPLNRRGDSFGFYSAGHQRQDIIWNWPTSRDWVHVEGIWTFDRGHPPARAEIHPAHFVAVQRHLPDKYEPIPGRYYFATRADIFANGDGNAVWNNKGLQPFAQRVKMSDRVYTVVFKHDLPRPTPNASLKYAFRTQKGDSYTGQPKVIVYENGTPDIPTPHVMMMIPWALDRAPDTAVFARSLFLYWDDLPSHGIPPNYPMKKVTVVLDKIVIQDKQEGSDSDPGEYRLFADIGGRWLFLNEFTGASDILSYGLGEAWDDTYSAKHRVGGFPGIPYPKPSKAEYEFNFNQTFEFYVPQRKEFRIWFGGWEGDYMDGLFGRIANPYLRCEDAVRYMKSQFNGSDYAIQGKLDDPVGEVMEFITNTSVTRTYSVESKGEITDQADDRNDPNKAFRANFRVIVWP